MKPLRALALLLGLSFLVAALVYQAVARDRDYRLQLSRGDAARRNDQAFAAIEAYSGAIVLKPDSMLPYLRRAETYQQRGDLAAAARDFRTAAALDPSATRPLEELGDVWYERQRYDAAAEAYERRLRLDDRAPGVSFRLALARYRDGDIDAALTALADTLRLNDRSADAHYLRGLCLREKRRRAEAIAALERAVSLSPSMIPAREELAELYAAAGRHAEELEQLQLLASLDRPHVERQTALASAQARAGHPELAVVTLGSALERAPDQPAIYGELGRVWLELTSSRDDALSKALQALERAAAMKEASSETLTLYGRALAENNEPESAERILRRATERFPVDSSSFLAYAAIAERQNHLDAAREALIDYGALMPNDFESAGIVQRIAALSKRISELPERPPSRRAPAGEDRSGREDRRQ
jgi:tetratricopeptide (TPR) repeat protein